MELLFTVGLIGAAAFVNILNFIVGMRNTPPGNIFLGTMHHPQDYFYYLSQFVQGSTSWFFSRNLYTHDYSGSTAVGWINVVTGKILGWSGLTHQWAYAVAVALGTLLFLGILAWLFRLSMPEKTAGFTRWLALLLFLISNTFPTAILGKNSDANTYWNNYGEPFVRLGGVPHHLIMHTMVALILILTALFVKTRSRRTMIISGIPLAMAAATLASINPVQWMWTGAALALSLLLYTLIHPGGGLRSIAQNMLPLCLVFLAGLPIALYLKQLFSLTPYTQLTAWEYKQQIHLSLPGLLLSSGPVVILGLLGIPLLLRKKSLLHILLCVYALGSIMIFLSPLPRMLILSNVRFVSGITVVCFALAAAELFTWLFRKKNMCMRFSTGILLCTTILLCLIPLRTQLQDRITLDQKNAFIYIPISVMQGYTEVIKQTPHDATILAYWPFEASLPAFTGRQVFFGHPLLTTDFERKSGEAYFFIDKRMTPEEMAAFLKRNNIDYIFGFNNTVPTVPLYDVIFKNDLISLYKVRTGE